MKNITYLLFISSLLLINCTDQKTSPEIEEIEKSKVDQVIDRAIEWAGGMERWRSLKQLTYQKRSRLLYENGQVEYDITQLHDYTFSPSLLMNINWDTEAGQNKMVHSDTVSYKLLNDSLISQGNKIRESAFSALYVIGMPFKLKDPGIHLSYEGQQIFQGRTADIIKATYSPVKYKNHSTSDDWWYYFDAENSAFLGCKVYHYPTYALIENIAFHEVEDMKFQKRRMSYRCDSLGNKQFLRAEFWYEDYDLVFNE